jgi:hypothetical protein
LNFARREAREQGIPFEPLKLFNNPTLEMHDIVKKGLDAMIDRETDKVTGAMSHEGRSLSNFKRAFVRAVDAADSTGIYKQARAIWGGAENARNAIAFGKRALGGKGAQEMTPQEIRAAFKELEEGEKEFARLGMADALLMKVKKTGLSSDEAKQIIRSEYTKEVMEPFFENAKDFENFVEMLERETDMFNLGRIVMGGSQTAERRAEDTSLENYQMASSAHLARNLAEKRWFTSLQMGLEMWRRMRDLGMANNPKLNDMIAEDLLTTPIPKTGNLQARLKGSRAQKHALPTDPNPLLPIEDILNRVGAPLATGAGAIAGQVQ